MFRKRFSLNCAPMLMQCFSMTGVVLETKRVSCCWMGACRATTLAWRSLAGCDMCASCYCPAWWSPRSCTLTVARCWYTAQMAGECTVCIYSARSCVSHSLIGRLPSSSSYALSITYTGTAPRRCVRSRRCCWTRTSAPSRASPRWSRRSGAPSDTSSKVHEILKPQSI